MVSKGATRIAFSISWALVSSLSEQVFFRAVYLTSQTVQLELIDSAHSLRILPVVLYQVDVVGRCEEPSKGRSL